MINATKKIGRNEPCACGSGLKFKKCCQRVSFETGNTGAQDNLTDGRRAELLFDSGVYYWDRNELYRARIAYEQAIELHPNFADAHNNLGVVYKRLNDDKSAKQCFLNAISINPKSHGAYHNLAGTLYALGDSKGALSAYENALSLQPSNTTAKYMCSALRGDCPSAAPLPHIRNMFDDYAEYYDDDMVGSLQYRIPNLLGEQLSSLESYRGHTFQDALDMGCGSGLSGLAFDSIARNQTGVDLSPRMIDRARAKGLYTRLIVSEVVKFLEDSRRKYDLLVACDFLIYLGDLGPFFKYLGRNAAEDALFLFSIETTTKKDYLLLPSGRFAQNESYVVQLGQENNFIVESRRDATVRIELGEEVPGATYIMRFSGGSS